MLTRLKRQLVDLQMVTEGRLLSSIFMYADETKHGYDHPRPRKATKTAQQSYTAAFPFHIYTNQTELEVITFNCNGNG